MLNVGRTGIGAVVALLLLIGCTGTDGSRGAPAAAELPEGALFAFGTARDGNGEIYLGTVSLGEAAPAPENLTKDPAFDGFPTWSPDGAWIAFDSDRAGGNNRDVYVMRSDGSGVRRLTEDPGFDFLPAWSPDGEWIAFVSTRDSEYDPVRNNSEAFRGEIYRIRPDGSALERLTEHAAHDQSPSWAPDGRRIVFCRDDDGQGDIVVLDVETRRETRLTNGPAFDCSPAWSPDGSHIAFTSAQYNETRLQLMRADGDSVVRIRTGLRNVYEPSWLPGGPFLCVTGEDAEGMLHVYAVRLDGGSVHRLTAGAVRDQACAFRPTPSAREDAARVDDAVGAGSGR